MEPYIVSDAIYLSGTVDSEPTLLEKDVDGFIHASTTSTRDMYELIYMTNAPVFEVWCIPPGNMVRDGSSNGVYTLGNWQAAKPEVRNETTPISAVVLNYFDDSDGALNRTSGIFTVPVSGTYRHSMTLQVRNFTSSRGSSGVFVQVNGVRTVGDYHRNAGDNAFAEYHHFHTELWHNAGDQVAFSSITNGGDGASGTFARWAVVRAATDIPESVA
ncbi:hypothetical protein QKT49_gp181 [Acanthamoeba castellanii medusavirus]|uniref:C1q domain-containing protein n=1 Tax=Acanthamoeba castellanii medusavirus J1 TaxID=3114988 RepID=A0A3T1CXL4_9VIRU|nr:hypothetical protein QKT49_gp181 [Acanthamoeba castellanii medusavirus]BBI30582.1 hypothetical protein [Acanthamoeba castellanii medusavirus J1]